MKTSSPDTSIADVLIVGAGPAGLALAIALAQAGIASTVLEQAPLASLADPPEDGRDIALTHRARHVLESLGLWQGLPAAEIAPLRQAQVVDGTSPWVLPFSAASEGHEALGWLVPNHHIRAACHALATRVPEIRLQGDACAVAFGRDRDSAWVETNGPQGPGTTRHRARLVVAADSRFSALRRLAGMGARMLDFGRTAIVCRMAHEREHEGVAHECFRYGNTLAMLPMAGRQSSAVLTVRSDEAPGWLSLGEQAFAARLADQFAHRLGGMKVAGRRHAYPLVATYAQRFADPRFALVGDAAVGMHPVTAHGYNFGLYGIERLAAALKASHATGRDLGDTAVLERWAAEHRRVTLPIYLGTNAIVRLFTDDRAPARLARGAVLRLASGIGPLKSAIARQLTGRSPLQRA
ncbi:5-demethoxyubiquinol-8 5-hydroxylase UbiM [Ideonella sp. YS5]|uniref:5-demethoxyubiquinol-8 5-hydroxylase UbiM n=1 Tax=Ideonella sp. YS5 TaxID=3453714 RepID=UPI003EE90A89